MEDGVWIERNGTRAENLKVEFSAAAGAWMRGNKHNPEPDGKTVREYRWEYKADNVCQQMVIDRNMAVAAADGVLGKKTTDRLH